MSDSENKTDAKPASDLTETTDEATSDNLQKSFSATEVCSEGAASEGEFLDAPQTVEDVGVAITDDGEPVVVTSSSRSAPASASVAAKEPKTPAIDVNVKVRSPEGSPQTEDEIVIEAGAGSAATSQRGSPPKQSGAAVAATEGSAESAQAKRKERRNRIREIVENMFRPW